MWSSSSTWTCNCHASTAIINTSSTMVWVCGFHFGFEPGFGFPVNGEVKGGVGTESEEQGRVASLPLTHVMACHIHVLAYFRLAMGDKEATREKRRKKALEAFAARTSTPFFSRGVRACVGFPIADFLLFHLESTYSRGI
jgi:hypothetical protein